MVSINVTCGLWRDVFYMYWMALWRLLDALSLGCRKEYVEMYIHHVLTAAPGPQYEAFKKGFFRCLDSNTLSLLLPQELQLLLLGSQEEISIAVLQRVIP